MLLSNYSHCGMIHKSYNDKSKGKINNYQDGFLVIFFSFGKSNSKYDRIFFLDLVDSFI